MASFRLSELKPRDYSRAYALASSMGEDRGLECWVGEIESKWRPGGDRNAGAAVLTRSDGYIFALFFYRILEGAGCGTVLDIRRVLLPDNIGVIFETLPELLDGFARRRGCTAIHLPSETGAELRVVEPGANLRAVFELMPAHWCRRVAPEAPAQNGSANGNSPQPGAVEQGEAGTP